MNKDYHSKSTEPILNSLLIPSNFNLSENDLLSLKASFITEEIAKESLLRRVSDEIGAQIIGRKRKAGFDYSGIVYSYFLPSDDYRRTQCRLRRDKPELAQNGNGVMKEIGKYLSAPGVKNMLYFPPNVQTEWLSDKSIPIVITEGEKKCLALYRLATEDLTRPTWHFLPVAISGVWNFRINSKETNWDGSSQIVKKLLSDFDSIALSGRKIIVLFDSNVRTNSNVAAARADLCIKLQQRGAKVFYAEIPEIDSVNGIDDLLGLIEKESGISAAIDKGLSIIRGAQKPQKNTTTATNFELIETGENAGVYYFDETTPKFKICGVLKILSETHDSNGENYGRLLQFSDPKGREKTYAMPLEVLHTDSNDLAKYLASRGLYVGVTRRHHEKLKEYINLSQPSKTTICTQKVGWQNGSFVFPNETIGGENEIVYQTEYAQAHKFNVKGTLDDWKQKIAKYCIGNSRLAFGVSVAFASPLLPIVEMQSGGFHFRDETSKGKTTVLFVSGSVAGGADSELGYCQNWRTTANGLESTAELHNHLPLILDELAQIDGKQAGDVAYMLANGEGKKRMTKSISARPSLSWQLLFLSSGEISLADKMSEAGLIIKGGQEIRILDIPADTGRFGVFENLHEFLDGRSFSDYLRLSARKYYGTPIREFLKRYIAEFTDKEMRAEWSEFQRSFINSVVPDEIKVPSEVQRAAARFALVAFAGEMATKLNITNWQFGEAVKAAQIVFQTWFKNRQGLGGSDAERAISQVRAFIELHGTSRFEALTDNSQPFDVSRIDNRAGFRKINESGEVDFLFLPETFRKEVCKGFDYKFVCKALDERGFLKKDSVGYQKQLKYGGVQIRPYWVSLRILESSDNYHLEGLEKAQTAK